MNPFTCQEFVEQVMDFLEGEVPDTLRITIEEHVGICSHCGQFLASYRATIVITRALPRATPPMPPELEARLRALLQEES
jgi:anti-sigma factor RsiW